MYSTYIYTICTVHTHTHIMYSTYTYIHNIRKCIVYTYIHTIYIVHAHTSLLYHTVTVEFGGLAVGEEKEVCAKGVTTVPRQNVVGRSSEADEPNELVLLVIVELPEELLEDVGKLGRFEEVPEIVLSRLEILVALVRQRAIEGWRSASTVKPSSISCSYSLTAPLPTSNRRSSTYGTLVSSNPELAVKLNWT